MHQPKIFVFRTDFIKNLIAQRKKRILDAFQLNRWIRPTRLKTGQPAGMRLATYIQWYTVYSACNGTIRVQRAFIVLIKQRATDTFLGGAKQNFRMIDFAGLARGLFLEEIGLAVCLVCLDQNFVSTNFIKTGKFIVQVQGFNKCDVKKGMTTVTASLLTTNFGSKIAGHFLENGIDLGHKRFILCEKM